MCVPIAIRKTNKQANLQRPFEYVLCLCVEATHAGVRPDQTMLEQNPKIPKETKANSISSRRQADDLQRDLALSRNHIDCDNQFSYPSISDYDRSPEQTRSRSMPSDGTTCTGANLVVKRKT